MVEKTVTSKKKVSTKKKTTATKKARPTLSQQVKAQSELIEQMTAELEEKSAVLDKLAKASDTSGDQSSVTSQDAENQDEVEALKAAIEEKQKMLCDMAAHTKVKNHIIASMALSLIPMPLLDVAALTAAQLNLLRTLCKHYGVDFDEQTGKGILNSLISGALPVASIVGLSSVIKVIPGIGTIGGGIGMATTTGVVTYATGEVFIQHFSNGGTLQDFNIAQWQEFFQEKLEEGKEILGAKKTAEVPAS